MSLEQHENFYCPHCGEPNDLAVDVTGGSLQSFVVDCEVCCSPVKIRLKMSGRDVVALDADKENG